MTSLALIDILLQNGTNIEQSGRIVAGANVLKAFGNRTQYVCGEVDEQFTYFYVYLNPLVCNGIKPCDCVLMDGEEQLIYLYKIEGV